MALKRTRYSKLDMFNLKDLSRPDFKEIQNNLPSAFSGSDLQMWFNDIPVAHVNSITCTINREIIGLYGMGTPDPLTMIKGKRAIVGSMTLTQFDKDAILYEVFNLHKGNPLSQADLIKDSDVYKLVTSTPNDQVDANGVIAKGYQYFPDTVFSNDGISQLTNPNLDNRIAESVRFMRDRYINYIDELPPINVTIVGANDSGAAAFSNIFGIHFAQQTVGFSMNDLMTPTTYSFTAMLMTPWKPLFDS